MARKKSGPSRLDLRREAEAAEAREKEKEDDELEDDDEDEDEEDEDSESTDSDDDDDEDEDEKPKKKKKQPAKKKGEAAKKPSTRKRAVKETRMKAIWVVFDNASKRVGVFPYNQKKDAEKLLAQKIEEKKATFYIQLVKEPMDEK